MRSPMQRLAELVIVLGLALGIAWVAHLLWKPVRVSGWSMHPALHVGDVVAVSLDGTRPQSGDVILVQSPGHSAVLHRVIDVQPDGSVHTKGDANQIPDFEPTPPSQIEGRVAAVLPVGELLGRWRGEPVCATMTAQPNTAQR